MEVFRATNLSIGSHVSESESNGRTYELVEADKTCGQNIVGAFLACHRSSNIDLGAVSALLRDAA